jgi:hypothetical protein
VEKSRSTRGRRRAAAASAASRPRRVEPCRRTMPSTPSAPRLRSAYLPLRARHFSAEKRVEEVATLPELHDGNSSTTR